MLRMQPFRFHRPRDLAEATALLDTLNRSGGQAKVIAGGTDLVPNMKHRITTPSDVVSLEDLALSGITDDAEHLHIGAMTRLTEVAAHPLVQRFLPALGEACGQIAGPQLRQMGTLGGNICLDTRCVYINQTHFWRQALGFCLKKDGTVCHVVQGGRQCVAAASNDSALPLLLYDAELRIASVRGERVVSLRQFFTTDGIHNTVLRSDEIVTFVRVRKQPAVRAAFEKLRLRKSIDYPILNLCVLLEGSESVERLEVALGALGAKPKLIILASLRGHPLNEQLVEPVVREVMSRCKPLENISVDVRWRQRMIAVLARRALVRITRTPASDTSDSTLSRGPASAARPR